MQAESDDVAAGGVHRVEVNRPHVLGCESFLACNRSRKRHERIVSPPAPVEVPNGIGYHDSMGRWLAL